jgi:hypothetical protein
MAEWCVPSRDGIIAAPGKSLEFPESFHRIQCHLRGTVLGWMVICEPSRSMRRYSFSFSDSSPIAANNADADPPRLAS